MKSAYAPLPFSYLSPDANPKVGLRKEGVYGTSADVPRVNQPVTNDYGEPQSETGNVSLSTEYPYSVYANANVLNPGTEIDYRGNHQQQPTPYRAVADHGVYSQYGPLNRPQRSEGGLSTVYPPSKEEDPYRVGIPRKKAELARKDEPSSDHIYRGMEAPSTHTGEAQQKQPPAMVSNDNFILVKDPNRSESSAGPQPTPANNSDRGKNNNLQTLFEAEEPKRQLPRYNVQPLQNHTDSRPQAATSDSKTSHNQEAVYDRAIYAPYLEPKPTGAKSATAANSQESIYSNGRQDAVRPDSYRNSDSRLVNESKAERNRTRGCVCGKCTAVIIAVIVTAIVCLGAGFVAGWFGAQAAGNGGATTGS